MLLRAVEQGLEVARPIAPTVAVATVKEPCLNPRFTARELSIPQLHELCVTKVGIDTGTCLPLHGARTPARTNPSRRCRTSTMLVSGPTRLGTSVWLHVNTNIVLVFKCTGLRFHVNDTAFAGTTTLPYSVVILARCSTSSCQLLTHWAYFGF